MAYAQKLAKTGESIQDKYMMASLDRYVREAKRVPLLTPEQEVELATRYRESQDEQARQLLIAANLRLVVKAAYQYHKHTHNILDLIQEGNLGLMQAVKRYNPIHKVRLASYALWWIKAYIYKYVLDNCRQVRVGTTQAERKLFFQMNTVISQMIASGAEPSNEALAQHFGLKESDIQWMRVRLSDSEQSINGAIEMRGALSEGREVTLQDTIACSQELQDETVAGDQLQQKLSTLLIEFAKTLNERQRFVFERRIMNDQGPLTLQQAGDRFGVSRERIRQVENDVLRKAATFLKKKLGDDFTCDLVS